MNLKKQISEEITQETRVDPKLTENGSEQSSLVPSRQTIVEFDQRLKNIEKMVEVVKHVADKGISEWGEQQERKAENERLHQEIHDGQHKRATWVFAGIVGVIFILCFTSLLKGEYELVKWILGSSFALGAGAGLTSLLQRPKPVVKE
jgi:hypothetical protein